VSEASPPNARALGATDEPRGRAIDHSLVITAVEVGAKMLNALTSSGFVNTLLTKKIPPRGERPLTVDKPCDPISWGQREAAHYM
jgi:hypothetical protein